MFERKKSAGKIYALPIESIQPSPFQARTNFNEQVFLSVKWLALRAGQR
jgi:hypothetical protein